MTSLLLVTAALVSVMGSVGADRRPVVGTVDGHSLVLTTADGLRCQGELLKMTDSTGLGSIRCPDGRQGSFNWMVVGRGAAGDGSLGGEPLTLTFTPD